MNCANVSLSSLREGQRGHVRFFCPPTRRRRRGLSNLRRSAQSRGDDCFHTHSKKVEKREPSFHLFTISSRASVRCRAQDRPLISGSVRGANHCYLIVTVIASFILWLLYLCSACGSLKQQVRKRAASSGSLLVCRCVEFHVACVLWARLCLSGLSCGQPGIDFSYFMHSIMATSCCRRTSRVWASRRCSSRTSEDLHRSLLNDSIRSAQQRAAAPWRPVFNSALLMENFCEATSKMLNSLKALSVPALLPVGRQCKSRRRRNPSEMFPLKLASKKLDEFQNMATKEENILDLEECAALRSHHELTQRVPPRVRRLLIFFLSGFQLPNTHCRLV